MASNEAGDIWDSEVFSQAVDAQLKILAKIITSSDPVEQSPVGGLIARGARQWPARPKKLQVDFQDAALRVRRALVAAELEMVSDFTAALRDWRQPLKDAENVRCKFKIVRVDMTATQPKTEVLVHLSGKTNEGVLQVTAIWNCQWTSPQGDTLPRLISIGVEQFEESLALPANGPLFADCTTSILGRNDSFSDQLAYGLDHWLERLELGYGISAASYQGVSVADVNGDGMDDVFVCQAGGVVAGLPNRLFLQMPDGTAKDASESSRLDWLTDTHSVLFIDLDNDGDPDLVAATVMGLVLAANDGRGGFSPKATELTPDAPPISLAAADFDLDGDLDIYAGCYSHRSSSQLLGRPVPYHDANNGGRNVLLRNDGQWRFKNVTKQVGLDQNGRRFSLACAWEDFDNDGDQDLYVANDYGRNNLYRNDGGLFKDVAPELGVEDISAGMSTSWGDFNQDGWMDLYNSNMWSSAGNRIAYQRRFKEGSRDDETRAHYQRHARGNSLFQNLGVRAGHAFSDISLVANVNRGRWAWSSAFFDINNDSYQDLYVANGFVTQDNPDDL